MATTTPGQDFPTPTNSDDPDIPGDLFALASAIEKRVVGIYNNVADRDTRVPAPVEGQVAYLKDTNSFVYYDSAAWVTMFPTPPTFTSSASVPSNGTGADGDVHFVV